MFGVKSAEPKTGHWQSPFRAERCERSRHSEKIATLDSPKCKVVYRASFYIFGEKRGQEMKATDKRFWIWEIAMTFLLSALPLMMYGENVDVIILIIVSYAIANAICLFFLSRIGLVLTWFLTYGTSIGAYIIDIVLIDLFGLIEMESYPLIVGQIYFLPIYLLVSGLICAVGGIIMSKT